MGACFCTGACRNGGRCPAGSDWGWNPTWPQPNTNPYHPTTTPPWYPTTPPVYPYQVPYPMPVIQGCICPPGAEKTCQGACCPRRGMTTISVGNVSNQGG